MDEVPQELTEFLDEPVAANARRHSKHNAITGEDSSLLITEYVMRSGRRIEIIQRPDGTSMAHELTPIPGTRAWNALPDDYFDEDEDDVGGLVS